MRKLFIILIFLTLTNCKGREKNEQKDKSKTEKNIKTFDIEKFEKNKVDGECNFVLADGTKIRQTSSESTFSEYITFPKPELFMKFKSYYKNGKLKRYIRFLDYLLIL
ncbi:MAG: hypothetical protein L3J23_05480 [Flavobacteriaceae bacterium]|nr:hypothetical protein [Flavobacteriaceae bacterium]